MRFYFHLQDGTETIHDVHGIEVAGLDEAKAEALSAIRDIRSEQNIEPHDWAGWNLAVADETGASLFSFDLAAHT